MGTEVVQSEINNVKIIQYPEPNARGFFTDRRISNLIQTVDLPRHLSGSDKNRLEEVGEIGINLYHQITKLPGIEQIFFKSNGITVFKAETFDWKYLQSAIIDILNGRETKLLPPPTIKRIVIKTVDETRVFCLSVDCLDDCLCDKTTISAAEIRNKIRGVKRVDVETYQIIIYKKEDHDWGEIETRVVKILKKHLFDIEVIRLSEEESGNSNRFGIPF